MAQLRRRSFDLENALALIDAAPGLAFEVHFGQTGWSTGHRLFYECEVGCGWAVLDWSGAGRSAPRHCRVRCPAAQS